jgi:hypothetical protein
MMTPEDMLDAAEKAITAGQAAHDLREELRWSTATDDPDRAARIDAALESLRLAMVPVRSAVGTFARHPAPEKVEQVLRTASAFVQYERKQLKKMRR